LPSSRIFGWTAPTTLNSPCWLLHVVTFLAGNHGLLKNKLGPCLSWCAWPFSSFHMFVIFRSLPWFQLFLLLLFCHLLYLVFTSIMKPKIREERDAGLIRAARWTEQCRRQVMLVVTAKTRSGWEKRRHVAGLKSTLVCMRNEGERCIRKGHPWNKQPGMRG
jgi:hypothetical protein